MTPTNVHVGCEIRFVVVVFVFECNLGCEGEDGKVDDDLLIEIARERRPRTADQHQVNGNE